MRHLVFVVAFAAALLTPLAASAQETAPLDREHVEAWAERTLGGLIENGGATGVVVSVVRGGEILFERGYGLANVTTRTPADARTRVRIGSNTKTFTATIIAQLMDEGSIESLERPANDYLRRYQLPANGASPILLRHLLTHTAGYEDRFFFIGANEPVEIPVRPEVFDTLRPNFARPVDEQVVYSNFAVAALGLVIEDQTQAPINEAMRARIFAPFGMTDTELVVSIDEPLNLAQPGSIGPGGVVIGPTPFTAINPAVAQTGSIVSTAHDMALYMNAHLGHGGLVSAQARARLGRRLAANAPEGAGVGMVFIEDAWAGRRTIGHGGNWPGFHSWFTLMPDEDVGVFVAIIGEGAPVGMWDRFRGALNADWAPPPSSAMLSASGMSSSFFAEFFGAKRDFAPTAAQGLETYAGFYRADRRAYSTSERLSSLLFFGADVVELTVGEGGLYLNGAGPWAPQGDGRFMLDAPARPQIIIRPNPRTGALVLTPDIGLYTMTRIDPMTTPKWRAILLHVLTPLLLLGLLTPLWFGASWKSWGAVAAGLGGAGMIGAAFIGLGQGEVLMTGYYAGHLGRVNAFIAAADMALIGAVAALVGAALTRGLAARLWLVAIGVIGVAIGALLLPYGGIGLGAN
ncbi:MAG TPA: serine hydrolase domain-containing protein [Terricaulis sp.]|nr:serine hydrolase domain-containing protein [Terricaulis sp.]